ncbi:DUF4870 domain-containing protein [Streptomyces natalensis]|uniref:Uncharacterized protein n=1 Tax=Streptomyces natalensis ATCC 27448 TaxID=1240678 RepID=A0A0D7CBM5_9ACTN|nr:DUF4870 domain-containing protein [Streptomyces natalensis]KIZ13310.1 hypothetical protein SNA_38275 [Streptomyces natalensis ATCC 27448]
MSDYHQPGYGPYPGGPQQPYGAQPGWGDPSAGGYGYQAPVPGYPAGPAYQQPGPGYDPQMSPPSKGPAMWAHLGALLTVVVGSGLCCGLGGFLGWVAPLSIRSSAKNQHDPYVRHHATQAMNFGFTQAIVVFFGVGLWFASGFTFEALSGGEKANNDGIAVPLLTVMGIMAAYAISGMVCAIIGTVKANSGQLWTYPRLIAFPMVKV